jgi:hypothetical protein
MATNLLDTGVVIEGYRIDGLIGEGGMGVVYEATQLALDRKVALKLISPSLGEDPAFRNRFRREGRIQASIDHAHIVTVYQAGESKYGLFIAMRLIRGSSLKDLILARELDAARAIKLLSQVADALDIAHAAGLIHRDIKPHNILVDHRRDHAYLADFGVTKGRGGTNLTRTGQMVGTIDYIAPEQIRGESATRHTDIYSLAAVLHECLTGVVPFPKESDVAVIYAHLTDPPPRVTDVRPELPSALDAVLEQGMAKGPSERYGSAVEMLDAARKALTTASGAMLEAPAPVQKPEEIGIRRPEGAVTTAPGSADGAPATEVGELDETGTLAPAADATVLGAPSEDTAAPVGGATVMAPSEDTAVPVGGDTMSPPARETVAASAAAAATTPAQAAAAAPARPAPPPPRAVPAERLAAPPRRGLVWILAGLLLVAALAAVGFLVGNSSGGDEEAAAPGSRRVESASIAVDVPSGWTRVDSPLPGMASDAQALSPSGKTDNGAIVFGAAATANWPTFFPPEALPLLPSSGRLVNGRDIVMLDGQQAYRYRDVALEGVGDLTAFVIPYDTAASKIVACVVPSGAGAFLRTCRGIAAAGEITTDLGSELAPSSDYAATLRSTISRLNSARTRGVAAMRKAKTPRAQGTAARTIAAAYETARRSLASVDITYVNGPANQAVVKALARGRRAYSRLSVAARSKNAKRYSAAVRVVGRAEARLRTALQGLEGLGYKLG